MLHTYSVTPMGEDHFEERVADLVYQVKSGITTVPLLMMVLHPEGNPVWDKATPMCELFGKYRDALSPYGIRVGILVQASIGHGYVKEPDPFQSYTDLNCGEERFVCCPEDDRFIEHFSGVMRKLAAEHPTAIMLDDDFRLMNRPGRGCACPLHLEALFRKCGVRFTREELWEHISTHPQDDPITEAFRETQRDSLIKAATAFRAAIDEVDPSIQGINCTSGHICESVSYTNKIFAGKGNPTIVRIPNGIYAPTGIRDLSETFRQAAICGSKLKGSGIDRVLAETDTIPFNRYSKSARFLHTHYAGSLLAGLKGAKHWLVRTSSYEPRSSVEYKGILAKHRGMYESVAALADEIRFVGVNSLFLEQKSFAFDRERFNRFHEEHWVNLNIHRMGLPFYFSDEARGATFLEEAMIPDMSDEVIRETFARASVFVDGGAAMALCERGFGELLGVKVSPWNLGRLSNERFDREGVYACTQQKDAKRVDILNEAVTVKSYNFRKEGSGGELISPAVTSFKRDGGKLSVVFCGSPNAKPTYTEGFAFLNESRKGQLVELLRSADSLPVYVHGDSEMMIQAGYLGNGDLMVFVTELCIDPQDSLQLYLKDKPTAMELMTPEGEFVAVEYEELGDDLYDVKVRVEPLYPLFIKIKQ